MSNKKSVPTVPVILEASQETSVFNRAIGHLHAALDALVDLQLLARDRGDANDEAYYYTKYLALDKVYWSLINR